MGKFNNYEAVMTYALEKCENDEEKQRVTEEDALFRKHGWEPYALFIANLAAEINESTDITLVHYSGSVADSFLLNTICSFVDNKKCLFQPRAHNILFNDAFRFIITMHEMFALDSGELKFLDEIFERVFNESKLYCEHKLVESKSHLPIGAPGKCDEFFVISKEPIPKEHFDLICNEPGNPTEEEENIICKYLLFKVSLMTGL